jgi:hypothetical protein
LRRQFRERHLTEKRNEMKTHMALPRFGGEVR